VTEVLIKKKLKKVELATLCAAPALKISDGFSCIFLVYLSKNMDYAADKTYQSERLRY
jgi:hypothetical protein